MDQPRLEKILWQQLSSLPYFRGVLRAMEQRFFSELVLQRPILDVGTGDGHFAAALFNDPVEVGLEPWRKPLAEANKRDTYLVLTQAQGERIPFPADTFYSVFSNSVLEHIHELEPVLQDIQRVLKPGGYFVFCVPNHLFLSELWGQLFLNKLGLKRWGLVYNQFFNKIARHYHLDDAETWKNRLKSVGFDLEAHWDYFPVKALHMLERGHIAGLPNLVWKHLFGRWILFPSRKNPFIPWKKGMYYLLLGATQGGTCTFFIARKLDGKHP